ncbi:unnamed protein product [Kuraishia capsulata CBS 1993]|uniref:Uncharacterized protein n=1 Tax=Kuraishia capsulata CBS 1993 TaxID=1382522 RepID=W6MQG8_9ASCO|nr:uncharacterized protein KUCA_T00004922001 [Kuraishia capsulata CBS 1993]CDK28936.1 unnamed protein product [Kuraishia capsulata CBS 1993]
MGQMRDRTLLAKIYYHVGARNERYMVRVELDYELWVYWTLVSGLDSLNSSLRISDLGTFSSIKGTVKRIFQSSRTVPHSPVLLNIRSTRGIWLPVLVKCLENKGVHTPGTNSTDSCLPEGLCVGYTRR